MGAVRPIDAVEALVAGALDPSLNGSVADVELLGDGALGVAAPDRCDDVAAAVGGGVFLLIVGRSGKGGSRIGGSHPLSPGRLPSSVIYPVNVHGIRPSQVRSR
jgi:hypothetical protein